MQAVSEFALASDKSVKLRLHAQHFQELK